MQSLVPGRRSVGRGIPAVLALVLAFAVVSGSAGALDLRDVQIKQIPEPALNKVMSEASSRPEDMTAYALLMTANGSIAIADTYFRLALGNWNPTTAKSYDYGGVTFKWQQSGNRWTWTWSSDEGGTPQSFQTEVVETAGGYDLSIQINGKKFLTGNVKQKGAAGTVTIYSNPEEQSGESFTTTWVPDAAPYATRFTVVGAGESAPGTVVLRSDGSGTNVKWSYTK